MEQKNPLNKPQNIIRLDQITASKGTPITMTLLKSFNLTFCIREKIEYTEKPHPAKKKMEIKNDHPLGNFHNV
jgi:hypothetical protein